MRKPPKVVIPKAMWTAGCCVRGTTVLDSFSMIGNNVPNKGKIEMSQVTVDKLKSTVGNVDLFPGNDGCQNKKIMSVFKQSQIIVYIIEEMCGK